MQPDDDAHELQWTNKADHDGSNGHTSTKYIPVANPSDNEAPTRPQARRQSILSRWLWELAASLLALILLLAIVAILVPHDGDEQPDWPHVTLGGVVAFIGTIIAAALAVPVASGLGQLKWGWFERERPLADFDVFDEASRGPWGGSKMLLKHRGGTLALFGATLCVLRLAVQIFLVQTVRLGPGSANVTDVITRMPLAWEATMLTNPNGSEAATADTNFTSALLSALYGLPTLQDYSVPTSCKTGNCTWGPYQTLAVCSTCQDITSQGSVNAKGDWSLPNGFRLAYLSNFNMTTSVQYEDSPLGPDITSLLESYAFADRGSIMADLFIAHYNNSDEVQAHECLLQYCVQTYNATEKNGILTETSMLPFAYSDDSTSAGADLLGPDSDRQSDIYLYNLRPPSSPSIPGLNTSQTFNVVSDAQSRISLLFATTFNGSQAANGGPDESFGTTQVASFFYDQITAVDNPIDYLNTMTGNIAASLTRHMRTHKWGDFGTLTSWRSPPMHTGIATRYAVVVHVQWAWIILPVIVLAATLIFLGAVIWAAERKRTFAWKNNALVPLMLDLDDEQLRHRLPGDLGELRDLEHALGKEKARMVWEGRVRFKTG